MKFKFLSLIQKANFVISYLIKNSFLENKFLKTIILEGAIVVDVGSNVGSFMKQILNINEKALVYSIEPNIDLIKFQKNKFKNKKSNKIFKKFI